MHPAAIFLETDRLLFRRHLPEDQPAFIEMHTNPTVRRYVGGPAWSREKAVDRFRTQYLHKPAKTYGLWATILKTESKKTESKKKVAEEEKFIGSTGLRYVRPGEASLGLYFDRPYWGHGLATEAACAFVDLAFTKLRLDRVVADVEKGHTASERVLHKLGFIVTRQESVPGSARIIRHFELPRFQWHSLRSLAE
jgi:RimJ/RimL family protein N-acetyltransferase